MHSSIKTILRLTAFGVLLMTILHRLGRRASKPGIIMSGAAHALSTTAASSKPKRIFCFGDSLTAGTTDDPFALYPYAPDLERSLQERGKHSVMVRHRGLPGWTTDQLLQDVDGSQSGMRTAIRAAQPLALVILLAGTNDLAYTSDASTIVENLKKLHTICHEQGVPKTLAIGIPPSGYQSVNQEARKLAQTVNQQLQQYCTTTQNKATYMEFPFSYSQTEGNFAMDGLHFTPQGYKLLGESLVPVVETMLNAIEKDQG